MEYTAQRICWHFPHNWLDSNVIIRCTCETQSPDFNIQLPPFMDVSSATVPTPPTEKLTIATAELTSTFPTMSTLTASNESFYTSSIDDGESTIAETAGKTFQDSKLVLVASTSAGGASFLLVLFIILLLVIYRSCKKGSPHRQLDAIPVTKSEACTQGGSPRELKRADTGAEGNNNPVLTASQDRDLDGSFKQADTIFMKGGKFKGHPV